MIVTDIIPVTKAKSKIYIDQEFAFVLYKGDIRLYHIAVDNEIAYETYDEICEVLLPKRAKKRCLMLLQKKDYTEEQLKRKLRDGQYPEYAISEAISYVKNYDYINDDRYCESYINCYAGSRSVQRITTDLLKKGVDKSVIKKAFDELIDRGDIVDEEELLLKCIKKKNYDVNEKDMKKRQKMYSHLIYKGFSSSMIARVLGNLQDLSMD